MLPLASMVETYLAMRQRHSSHLVCDQAVDVFSVQCYDTFGSQLGLLAVAIVMNRYIGSIAYIPNGHWKLMTMIQLSQL